MCAKTKRCCRHAVSACSYLHLRHGSQLLLQDGVHVVCMGVNLFTGKKLCPHRRACARGGGSRDGQEERVRVIQQQQRCWEALQSDRRVTAPRRLVSPKMIQPCTTILACTAEGVNRIYPLKRYRKG